MTALRALLGLVVGFGVAFGACFVVLGMALGLPSSMALPVAIACGVLGGAYSCYAFSQRAYTFGFFSIVGYLMDMTWSLLNTTAGFLVWVPACAITGANFVEATDDSQRSGTLVFDANPRGGGYMATTIGTVIAGGWCSHEETHVWQARIFGPAYLLVYIVALLLNMLFRLVTGHTDSVSNEAYYRVCFEDWAYAAGSISGGDIDWGMWFVWFLLTAVYVSFFVLISVGIAVKILALPLIAAGGLIVYSLIRTLAPTYQ